MNKSLRVLLVAPIRYYNAEAEYVHRLARGLRERGHHPVIMGLAGSPLLSRAAEEALPVNDRFDLLTINPFLWPRLYNELYDFILDQRFDVIDVHRSEGFAFTALAARKADVPVVRTRADMRPVRKQLHNRWLYGKLAQKIVASNRLLQEEMILRLGLPRERTATVYFGMEPDEFRPTKSPVQVRAELGIPEDAPVVGMMGRLGPVKGHDTLLKAVPELVERHPEIRFLIVYPDVEKSSDFLQRVSASPYRERFISVGPTAGLADVLNAADLGIIISTGSEAHCRVALQWMLLEKPLIGTRVGVIPEIIVHAETGFLIQPRYSSTLALCITELLQNKERAGRMGAAGRQRLIENFTSARQLDDTLAIYQSIIRLPK